MSDATLRLVIDGGSIAFGAGIIALLGNGFFGSNELLISQQIFLLLSGIVGSVVARIVARRCFMQNDS